MNNNKVIRSGFSRMSLATKVLGRGIRFFNGDEIPPASAVPPRESLSFRTKRSEVRNLMERRARKIDTVLKTLFSKATLVAKKLHTDLNLIPLFAGQTCFKEGELEKFVVCKESLLSTHHKLKAEENGIVAKFATVAINKMWYMQILHVPFNTIKDFQKYCC